MAVVAAAAVAAAAAVDDVRCVTVALYHIFNMLV